MMCSEQYCHGLFETLPVLWNKYLFIKRCAFRHSTRICKIDFRFLKNKCIIEKKVKNSMSKIAKNEILYLLTGTLVHKKYTVL